MARAVPDRETETEIEVRERPDSPAVAGKPAAPGQLRPGAQSALRTLLLHTDRRHAQMRAELRRIEQAVRRLAQVTKIVLQRTTEERPEPSEGGTGRLDEASQMLTGRIDGLSLAIEEEGSRQRESMAEFLERTRIGLADLTERVKESIRAVSDRAAERDAEILQLVRGVETEMGAVRAEIASLAALAERLRLESRATAERAAEWDSEVFRRLSELELRLSAPHGAANDERGLADMATRFTERLRVQLASLSEEIKGERRRGTEPGLTREP